jgi:hypothetical protein
MNGRGSWLHDATPDLLSLYICVAQRTLVGAENFLFGHLPALCSCCHPGDELREQLRSSPLGTPLVGDWARGLSLERVPCEASLYEKQVPLKRVTVGHPHLKHGTDVSRHAVVVEARSSFAADDPGLALVRSEGVVSVERSYSGAA